MSHIFLKCKMLISYNPKVFIVIFGYDFLSTYVEFKMFSDLLWMRLKYTVLVLLMFSEILLALSHWTKLERSWLIFLFISFKEELTYKILVSSAKWFTDENSIGLLRSLKYIRNSRGPNIEPWGMPNSILESSDCLQLTVVNYFMLVK